MKPTLILAVLAIAFASCKKDSFSIPDVTPSPELQAKIYRSVNQPREVTLGDSSAIFEAGERVTIYIPYEAKFDALNKAFLVLKDEDGNELETIDITAATEMNAIHENVPVQIAGSSFVFASFDINELYAGKWITIEARVSGNLRTSDDSIQNAFYVNQ